MIWILGSNPGRARRCIVSPKASIQCRKLEIKSHGTIVGIVTMLLDSWHPDWPLGPSQPPIQWVVKELIITVKLKDARKYFAFAVFFAL